MKFVPAKCPTCQGDLQIPDDREFVKCMYCGVDIKVREVIYVVESHLGDIPYWLNDARRNYSMAIENKSDYSDDLWNLFLSDSIKDYDKIIIADKNYWEAYLEKGIILCNMSLDKIVPCFVNSKKENTNTVMPVHMPYYWRFLAEYANRRKTSNVKDAQYEIYSKCINFDSFMNKRIVGNDGMGKAFDSDIKLIENSQEYINAIDSLNEFLDIEKAPSKFNLMKDAFISAIYYSEESRKADTMNKCFENLNTLIYKYESINTNVEIIPFNHKIDLTYESHYVCSHFERYLYYIRGLIYMKETLIDFTSNKSIVDEIQNSIKRLIQKAFTTKATILIVEKKLFGKEEYTIDIDLKLYEPYLSILNSLREKYSYSM